MRKKPVDGAVNQDIEGTFADVVAYFPLVIIPISDTMTT
jgi:hypothetical protein